MASASGFLWPTTYVGVGRVVAGTDGGCSPISTLDRVAGSWRTRVMVAGGHGPPRDAGGAGKKKGRAEWRPGERRGEERVDLRAALRERATGRAKHATTARRGRDTVDSRTLIGVGRVERNRLQNILRLRLARTGGIVRDKRRKVGGGL